MISLARGNSWITWFLVF